MTLFVGEIEELEVIASGAQVDHRSNDSSLVKKGKHAEQRPGEDGKRGQRCVYEPRKA